MSDDATKQVWTNLKVVLWRIPICETRGAQSQRKAGLSVWTIPTLSAGPSVTGPSFPGYGSPRVALEPVGRVWMDENWGCIRAFNTVTIPFPSALGARGRLWKPLMANE